MIQWTGQWHAERCTGGGEQLSLSTDRSDQTREQTPVHMLHESNTLMIGQACRVGDIRIWWDRNAIGHRLIASKRLHECKSLEG